jgi:transposase
MSFKRIGAELSRENMTNWQNKSCERLEPLLALMKAQLAEGSLVNMDETKMLVMDETGRKNSQESRMWLARGGPPGAKVVWYEYTETRKAEHIKAILGSFKGWLQSDGYSAYKTAMPDFMEVTHVCCFAHVRRRFFNAWKVTKDDKSAAAEALNYIKKLYEYESLYRKALTAGAITQDEFLEERGSRSRFVLKEFHRWLLVQQGEVTPTSLLGDAVSYALGLWTELQHYLDYWETTPDNQAAERAIRPIVVGRKNWVMSDSPAGARTSCQLFTLIETAKENGLNPYWYLVELYTRVPLMTEDSDWSDLLPWKISLSKPLPVPSWGGGN